MSIKKSIKKMRKRSCLRCINLFITCLIALFFLPECQTNEKKSSQAIKIEIDLDRKNGPTPIVSIDRIIPLEMTENSILSDTYGLNVKYYDNKFYVLDIFGGRCLYVFNNEGLLINRTKTGRGPGELINPFAFDIDRDNNIVQLWDQRLSSMINLDLNLSIVSSSKLDTIRIIDFRILNNNRVLVYHNVLKDGLIESNQLREYYQYTLYEENFSISTRLNLTVFSRNPPVTLPNPFSIGDEILLIAPRDLAVYKLVDAKVEPAYRFDFGKYGFSQDELQRLSDNEKEYMENNGERSRGMGIIQKTHSFLMSVVVLNNQPVTIFHSLETGINYNLNECFDKNLLPVCFTQFAIEETSFLALVEPGSLKSFVESNSQYSDLDISEDDNPYIIIYTIKEK
jgi:hypothetical protein